MWFGAVSIGVSATLALATTLVFLRAWRADDSRAGWIAAGLCAAALLAHESAVALPALLGSIVVYEWAAGGRARRWPPRSWVWAGVGVLFAHLALLAWAYRTRAAAFPDSGYRFVGLDTALLLAPLRYTAQLVVPPPWTETLAAGDAGSALSANELESRLIELGFVEGARVEVLHEGIVGGDPIAVRVENVTIAVRRREAMAIIVA